MGTRSRRRTAAGALIALAFNLCLIVLPVSGAMALLVIARDHLYAYEYSEAGARAIRARVERLNGGLIEIDFDRLRQWDDLVALELMGGDVPAARGFLLSGGGMLPDRLAKILNRSDNDAEREAAALELLSPGTRSRYESTVPLLSRRAASGAAQQLSPATDVTLGDAQDFELMARALLSEPETDSLQFVLAGFSLGLAGETDQRLLHGAAALLIASRRPDYPVGLQQDVNAIITAAAPLDAFRAAALRSGDGAAAGNYANAAAAFRASVNPAAAARARTVLEEIGAMADAISISAASDLLMHANSARDLARLRLLAQSAGDRAAAAAKRLPRDGRLLSAARGDLTMNRDLAIALTFACIALLGLVAIVIFKLYQAARPLWRGHYDDEEDYGGELVDLGGGIGSGIGASNWRPL
jgi:hypothetical protein